MTVTATYRHRVTGEERMYTVAADSWTDGAYQVDRAHVLACGGTGVLTWRPGAWGTADQWAQVSRRVVVET